MSDVLPHGYFHVVVQCVQSLRTVEVWLNKAEQYAAAKKCDVGILMSSRIAPDMKDFIYQVQSACDYVKGAAAWLSGQAPPRHEDTERTIDQIRARLRKTIDFAGSVSEAQYAGAGERRIEFSWAPGKVLAADDYLLQMVVPNVYFHLTTAYAILRHNGVEIGKMDFLQPVNFVDA